MYKKPLFQALVFMLLLSSQISVCPAESVSNLTDARDEVCGLIDFSKYSEASALVDKLIADNTGNPELPSVLFDIAESYRWADKREKAEHLYQQIIQNYSGRPEAAKAKLGLAREEIISLIISHDYSLAEEKINKIVSDFRGDIDLPDALYWIAERYRWEHKWEKANNIYSQIIQNHPDSSYASRANLGIARAKVLSLLVAQDYIAANQALDKLVIDFEGHPDLPETLYWIAEGYRWGDKYEKAKLMHEQIMRNYPDSLYASKAKLGIARIVVLSSIDSRDYSGAQKALDKLVADFSGHPDLPDTLYWIAEKYRWSDKYEITKEICKQIIQEYPETLAADKARQQFRVTVQGIDVFALIESNQEQIVQSAIDQLMTNSDSNESDEISPYTVFLCGDRYYVKGLRKRNDGLEDEAVENFTKAINIWEKMIQQLPTSTSKAHAYYRSANCYVDLGQYDRAVERYTELIENYPDYYLAWDAKFKIGRYYQKLKDAGAVDEPTADAHTKVIYEQLLERYPDCPAAKAAKKWLKKHPQ